MPIDAATRRVKQACDVPRMTIAARPQKPRICVFAIHGDAG